MRILFASPDRDLVRCYVKLLSAEKHFVAMAFDGTQVMELIKPGDTELIIMSDDLTRVSPRKILEHCNAHGIPVIMLVTSHITGELLLDSALACALLPLPFRPAELMAAIESVQKLLSSDKVIELDGRSVRMSEFQAEGVRFTDLELGMLESLYEGRRVENGGIFMGSLKRKLAKLGVTRQIRYLASGWGW